MHFCALINFYGSRCAMPYFQLLPPPIRHPLPTPLGSAIHTKSELFERREKSEGEFFTHQTWQPQKDFVKRSKVMVEPFIIIFYCVKLYWHLCRGWCGLKMAAPSFLLLTDAKKGYKSSNNRSLPTRIASRPKCNSFFVNLPSARSTLVLTPLHLHLPLISLLFLKDDKLLFSG